MKLFKKLLCASAVAMSMVGAAHADTVINDWKLNPIGGGFGTATQIHEYLNISGNAFIKLSPGGSAPGSFNFEEFAAFGIPSYDGHSNLSSQFAFNYPGGNLSALFHASGSGTFGGNFTFNTGTIDIYQHPLDTYSVSSEGIYGANPNVNTKIAHFDVVAGGGGKVNGTGDPTGNGEITVFAKASANTDIKPGYFFLGSGADLSFQDTLAFAFTNAVALQNLGGASGQLQVKEIICEYAGFTAPGLNCGSGTGYSNAAFDHFYVSNDGQFKLASDVPEPGSLALFGIAVLGAGFVSRKRSMKA